MTGRSLSETSKPTVKIKTWIKDMGGGGDGQSSNISTHAHLAKVVSTPEETSPTSKKVLEQLYAAAGNIQ